MKTRVALISTTILALLAAGCAGPSIEKLRAQHAKKFPIRPLPMPLIVTKTNGIVIQEQRPFIIEKKVEDGATFFVPAAVDMPPGVMVGTNVARVWDGTDWWLIAEANQGSNTVAEAWKKATVDGGSGFFPIVRFDCWPAHQTFWVFTDGWPSMGYIKGSNIACTYVPPAGFNPAAAAFTKQPTGKYITLQGERYEIIKLGGARVKSVDANKHFGAYLRKL